MIQSGVRLSKMYSNNESSFVVHGASILTGEDLFENGIRKVLFGKVTN